MVSLIRAAGDLTEIAGWPHSVHTVAFKDDGTFCVDMHNFDPDYEPGDYAWTVYVLLGHAGMVAQARLTRQYRRELRGH
jgi:hypothetical protein